MSLAGISYTLIYVFLIIVLIVVIFLALRFLFGVLFLGSLPLSLDVSASPHGYLTALLSDPTLQK